MLDWVDMDVIDVACEIALIADRMFPVAPLSDAAFASSGVAIGYPFAGREAVRECRFDELPARGEIRVTFG